MSLPHSLPEPSPPESTSDPAAPIRLPAQCGTAAAPALHRALIDAVAGSAPPAIDAGEVDSLGQAVLQLLLAARVAAPGLVISPISPAFAERVRALRLAPALGLEGLAR
jgi:anti-anti-sigma regulatory factor